MPQTKSEASKGPGGEALKQRRLERAVRARPEARARRGKRVGSKVAERVGGLYKWGSPRRLPRQRQRGKRMRIERRYTKAGQSPYADIEFRLTTSEIRNPDGSVVFRARQCRGARVLVAGRLRRAGAEIFPQGRRARAPEEGRGRDRALLAVALGRRRGGARGAAREASATSASTRSKQVFDRLAGTWTYWGWKGGYFDTEEDAQRLLRRAPLHAGHADGARRTRRNGSTPACTGPTASTARARATTTSTSRPAS